MDCLYADCIPCVTDCVLAELEKLGQQYRVALKIAKVNMLLVLPETGVLQEHRPPGCLHNSSAFHVPRT